MDRTFHYVMGFGIILAYIVPVLLAKNPLNKNIFRKYISLLFILLVLLFAIVFIIPDSMDIYYKKIISILIIITAGGIFYVSARRYVDIGGGRWNIFVAFIHFSEFMRLWWEEPKPPAAAAKSNTDKPDPDGTGAA
jgi:hypothetical protein